MKEYWVITERVNADSLSLNGFRFSSSYGEESDSKIHVYLTKKKIFPFYISEEPDDFDTYIKDFDINKYNQLILLVSLGMSIKEALKEIE